MPSMGHAWILHIQIQGQLCSLYRFDAEIDDCDSPGGRMRMIVEIQLVLLRAPLSKDIPRGERTQKHE